MKEIKKINIGASIFEENDRISENNRLTLIKNGVFALNIMGSPGSGKTSVLEKTVSQLKNTIHMAVIEGDIKGSADSERLHSLGLPVVQINTGGGCHLDANMVAKGMENLPLQDIDILFIENVGNLVCPAEFAIGANANVIISSVPEGAEKPLKYPLMFQISEICILNKTDLLEQGDFNLADFKKNLEKVAPLSRLITLSAKTGEGFSQWTEYLSTACLSALAQHDETLPSLPELKGRIVVLGIGNRLKRDDGAGSMVAEMMLKEKPGGRIKIIDAGGAAEKYIGAIEKYKPAHIVIIDAADFGGRPGEMKVLNSKQIKETTSSTHTFSLSLIIRHVCSETGAKCTVIGIQPKTTAFGEGLSPEVEKAVYLLAHTLLR